MLITDKKDLARFGAGYRIWQGIPGIEVTRNGRIFSAFYSGGTKEEIGNYALLIKSDDGGKNFSEPIAVAYKKEGRCFDEVLWIDPAGRLWFTWGYASGIEPEKTGVYGSVCDDPDADEIVFSEPFFIGKNVMMNKPTVLSSGEWLFPIAIWLGSVKWGAEEKKQESDIPASYAYRTADGGKSFEKLGGVDTLLIGDVIEQHYTAANYNMTASLSFVLMLILILGLAIVNHYTDSDEGGGGMLI